MATGAGARPWSGASPARCAMRFGRALGAIFSGPPDAKWRSSRARFVASVTVEGSSSRASSRPSPGNSATMPPLGRPRGHFVDAVAPIVRPPSTPDHQPRAPRPAPHRGRSTSGGGGPQRGHPQGRLRIRWPPQAAASAKVAVGKREKHHVRLRLAEIDRFVRLVQRPHLDQAGASVPAQA